MHQPLPITSITLFSTSIAYLTRAGTPSSPTTSFLFPTPKINHILKSLSISSKVAIRNITYESKEQNRVKLRSGDDTSFWTALKGVLVHITHDNGKGVQGFVMNQVRMRQDNGTDVNKVQLMGHENGMIQWVDVSKIESMKIMDERMESELRDSLKERKVSRIVVTMAEGRTPMRMYYSMPLTVWKISYRIILGDEEDDMQQKETPQGGSSNQYVKDRVYGKLMGFAIVDNNLEEDWDNIALTLVSGSPVSFDHDLFTPQTRHLPHLPHAIQSVTADDIRNIMERQNQEGSDSNPSEPPGVMPKFARGTNEFKKRKPQRAHSIAYSESEGSEDLFAAPIQKSSTKQESSADMFQYKVPTKVTIRAMESALVPIIEENVTFTRVALYKSTQESVHPLTSLSFHNQTPLTFEAGPLTVSTARGMLLGESVLQMRKPQEKQFIPYSQDSSLIVSHTSSTFVDDYTRNWSMKIQNNGIASTDVSQVRTVKYTILNRSQDQQKNLLIQHEITHSHDTECYVNETRVPCMFSTKNFATYQIPVAAKETLNVNIMEVKLVHRDFNFRLHLPEDHYKQWVQNKLIADTGVIRQFDVIRQTAKEIDTLQSQNAQLIPKESHLLSQIQTYRQNLQAIPGSSDAKETRRRYLEEMASLETEWRAVLQQKQNNVERIDELKKLKAKMAEDIVYSNSYSRPSLQRGAQ